MQGFKNVHIQACDEICQLLGICYIDRMICHAWLEKSCTGTFLVACADFQFIGQNRLIYSTSLKMS